MLPTYKSGDHVLTSNWFGPKVGDVIVFRSGNIYKIKRVVKTSVGSFFVAGDNKELSSKEGSVKKKNVVGKVILKY